jgi:hypothetical protein
MYIDLGISLDNLLRNFFSTLCMETKLEYCDIKTRFLASRAKLGRSVIERFFYILRGRASLGRAALELM